MSGGPAWPRIPLVCATSCGEAFFTRLTSAHPPVAGRCVHVGAWGLQHGPHPSATFATSMEQKA